MQYLGCKVLLCRSQWPRGLRRRYAAARLLRLWVRFPPAASMFIFCECCVCCQGRGLCDELITRPEESYRLWSVVVCDLETSWMRRPWLLRAVSPKTIKVLLWVVIYLFYVTYTTDFLLGDMGSRVIWPPFPMLGPDRCGTPQLSYLWSWQLEHYTHFLPEEVSLNPRWLYITQNIEFAKAKQSNDKK